MYMSEEQTSKLIQDDDATVMLCYHGIGVIHECPDQDSDGHVWIIVRLIGHLINGSDYQDEHDLNDPVPDHKTFSIDIPLPIAGVASLASAMTEMTINGLKCGTAESDHMRPDQPMPNFGMFTLPVSYFPPGLLEWMKGNQNGDENGGRFPWM